MKRLCAIIIAAAMAFPAAAHDMWLQPTKFWLERPGISMVTTYVGHGPDRERWSVAADRVLRLRSVGPGGVVTDQRGRLGAAMNRDAGIMLATPGVHVIALESGYAESNLPAARFNGYLQDEGLIPAIEARRRAGQTGRPGREIYNRRAKALVQVGPVTTTPQPQVVRAVGLALEIVPERNPYRLDGAKLMPVRVFYQGRPLAGALVRLTDLRADAKPAQSILTDKDGRAIFKARHSGLWQMNVVWTKPLAENPKADFETTFSSLTWGFPN